MCTGVWTAQRRSAVHAEHVTVRDVVTSSGMICCQSRLGIAFVDRFGEREQSLRRFAAACSEHDSVLSDTMFEVRRVIDMVTYKTIVRDIR